jgi:hypothetical protein
MLDGFHLCVDGPLAGEVRNRGTRFVFDGDPIGLPSGSCILDNRQYRWQADVRPHSAVLVQSSYQTALTIKLSPGGNAPKPR